MDIGDRIKALRKELKLTQQEFADAINIQRGAVASWEVKRTVPNTPSLSLICREFGVNREWLETGEGEMYRPTSQHEQLAAFFGSLLDGSVENETKLRLMTCLSKLSPDEWELLYKIAKEWTQDETEGQT